MLPEMFCLYFSVVLQVHRKIFYESELKLIPLINSNLLPCLNKNRIDDVPIQNNRNSITSSC
jgi:hypothetical protein